MYLLIREQQAKVKKLSILAGKVIEDNRLIYPEKTNAEYYFQSVIEFEPDNKKIKISTIHTS